MRLQLENNVTADQAIIAESWKSDMATDRIRIIKHEAIPGCGSFEVRYPDDRPGRYFYRDSLPSRRLRPETLGAQPTNRRSPFIQSSTSDLL